MIAHEAANKITAPLREGGENEALVSIVFSVVAVESFLNEAREFAPDGGTSVMAAFGRAMRDLAQTQSITLKYSVSHLILTGKHADFGAPPYQDLRLLVSLRNELVHFKPTVPLSYDPEYHPVRETLRSKLESKNMLAQEAESGESWLYHVSTKAVAEWACNTAANVILDFCNNVPQGTIISDLREPYFSLRF
jgi:hypothetical protein